MTPSISSITGRPDSPSTLYRIGAVATMTGIPVSTLRVWEVRHQAFSPIKTAGKHRLYTQEDVQRASLLKQLSEEGHVISAIAGLESEALGRLQQQAQVSAHLRAVQKTNACHVSVAVIGAGVAGRLESEKFTHNFQGNTLHVTDTFLDLAQADAAHFRERPQILLVKVNALHDSVRSKIQQLASKQGIRQTIVVYSFAQEAVVEAMRMHGIMVRREPISDYELSDLISSVLLVDTAKTVGGLYPNALIPPRKYADETLARVAAISTNVLCECPRHVAELILQLANFEEYSQECLNKSDEDAHLHGYLHAISGSARALFERALEMVAEHENISLATTSPLDP